MVQSVSIPASLAAVRSERLLVLFVGDQRSSRCLGVYAFSFASLNCLCGQRPKNPRAVGPALSGFGGRTQRESWRPRLYIARKKMEKTNCASAEVVVRELGYPACVWFCRASAFRLACYQSPGPCRSEHRHADGMNIASPMRARCMALNQVWKILSSATSPWIIGRGCGHEGL